MRLCTFYWYVCVHVYISIFYLLQISVNIVHSFYVLRSDFPFAQCCEIDKIEKYRDAIDFRDYTSLSKFTKDFVWRPAATVTSLLALCVFAGYLFRRIVYWLCRAATVGVADDNISTVSGDICSGGVSGCRAVQKKDSSHKV